MKKKKKKNSQAYVQRNHSLSLPPKIIKSQPQVWEGEESTMQLSSTA